MFTGLLETIKGFLSRSFWFGSFLPVAIVVFVHGVLTAIYFPARLSPADLLQLSAGEATGRTLLALALLVALAYLVTPLVPLFHGLIDGSLLPEALHDLLRRSRLRRRRSLIAKYKAVRLRAAQAESRAAGHRESLKVKRAEGVALGTIQNSAAITTAEQALKAMAPPFGKQVDEKAVSAAADSLAVALASNTASAKALAEPELQWAQRLDAAHLLFLDLLKEHVAESRHGYDALLRRNAELDLGDWQATRLGDVRRLSELYPEKAYGAEFSWLWPRIEAVIPAEDKGFPERIADSKAQLDFSVLLLVLVQTIPLIWVPVLTIAGAPLWAPLLIAWLAPPVNAGLYQIVIASQSAFGRVVETAIDTYRFDVLKALHQPRPLSLAAERHLWRCLSRVSSRGHDVDLLYPAEPVR
ncbi:MAG TPA: hypothetical protein VK403_09730 [Allosphingosinicella sp.]|nr:hypothetical protein [Allosphingosinicella sp.]